MNQLIVSNLDFNFKNIKALNNVNLDLKDGVIALLGPNGAGKSTLMKLLVTIYETKHGSIKLNNLNYKTDKSKIKSSIGYLPQDFDMYKNITGNEYLSFVSKMKGIDKRNINNHINEIVKQLNLEDFIDKKIGTYSGGVKRRLGIAQSLVSNPNIIIMDEPTVGLDPEQRNEFRKLLPLISKNRIVLISTHIVEDIQFSCNKLIILNKGNILYDGSMNQLMDNITIFTAVLSEDEFNNISNTVNIIDYKYIESGVEIKYVSKSKEFKNSTRIDTSLQDAYVHFLRKVNV